LLSAARSPDNDRTIREVPMTTILASTALVLIAQLAAPQAYRPSAKLTFGGPKQFFLVKPTPGTGQAIDIYKALPPQVLCTMPMLRPQGDVDPKIVAEPPKNGAKIRTIDAPACIEKPNREPENRTVNRER
jgi:hypothetical protein